MAAPGQQPRVILTGAGGFLGRAVGPVLEALGYTVLNLDRRAADVTDRAALLSHATPAEALVHLAFPTSAAFRRAEPAEALHAVIAGTTNAVSLALISGARHVVLASSGKVYGPPLALPIDEDHPLRPNTFLGELKVLAESILELATRRVTGPSGPLAVTALRLFNVYGPGQREDFLVAHLMRGLRSDEAIPLGELDHARDYLHVDDASSAIATIIARPPLPGQLRALNAGSGSATSPREILAMLGRITGRSVRTRADSSRLRPEEAPEERADAGRLRALGWTPRIALESGLRALWEATGEGKG